MAFLSHIFNHYLSFKHRINWGFVYMIWPTLGQSEAVGEGMKKVGLSPTCISRVHTFEEEILGDK